MLNTLLEAMWHTGHTVIVAAGNDNRDVRSIFPARESSVITAGAAETGERDSFIQGTNFGPGIDVFAPGRDIDGACFFDENLQSTTSGTSGATGIVAGLALYYMRLGALTTPQQVKDRLVETSTKGRIQGLPPGTENRLVYNMVRGPGS